MEHAHKALNIWGRNQELNVWWQWEWTEYLERLRSGFGGRKDISKHYGMMAAASNTLVSHMGASSNPGCPTSDPAPTPTRALQEAMGGGSCTHMRGLEKASCPLASACPSLSHCSHLGDRTSRLKILLISLPLSPSVSVSSPFR